MTSSFPLTRRQALVGAVLLVALLAIAGKLLAGQEAEPVEAGGSPAVVVSTATAELPQVVVHVVGAVRRPGLYRLDEGSRVADAVDHAGGPTRKADLAGVNLAAPLLDGSQVVVPRRGARAVQGGAVQDASSSAPAGPLHLSTATAEQLDALPGVGPVTAQRIVEYRELNGPFRSIDDLDAVAGIGPSRLEQLRELVVP